MTRASTAIVTGAASGIGAAVCATLRRAGWAVGGIDLHAVPEDVPVHGSARADVADEAAVADAMADLADGLGPVDALVTAAGYYEMMPFSEISEAAWERMLAVLLGGTVNAIAAVLPGMLARGAGSIVTITSELGLGGGDGDAHYAAAKGAVIGLTKALAVELAPAGVRVNSVAPGPTDTPLLAADSPWRDPEYLRTLPLRRLVRPAEVAHTVAHLVCDEQFFCGEILSPNAGAVI
ncbi:MAG TPA: SDR family oxidoreductase [Solirubrobacteraceae bacterium]|nr:SDR family oxidoreductase [Solirubrobacteraceae bacterium]